jgi:hypothetical protein
MRASFISLVCFLFSAYAGAQSTSLSLDALTLLPANDRADALFQLRESSAGLPSLQELDLAARMRVDARRESNIPPLSLGCLTPGEFDLDTLLGLARESKDRAAFHEAVRDYRRKTAELDAKLAAARRTNLWWKHFPTLRQWEREWRAAKEPRTRELLYRTLSGQAIRASLEFEHAPAIPAGTKGQRRRAPRSPGSSPASTAYREYVFNLMCTDDEQNLNWFKQQIAEIGWFDMRRYGWAADRAALLIVQHADADPGFQSSVVRLLEPRLEAGDTDPENFAYLVDRVAVRSGQPQRFGTQMDCVKGEWIVPEIVDQTTLDARRKRMNLVAYGVQRARTRGLCRD